MQEWVEAVKERFNFSSKDIQCLPATTTCLLEEKAASKTIEYKVTFSSPGICIKGFDKVTLGVTKGDKSFDVLSASPEKVRYIELKSSIGKNQLKKMGEKFYHGHCKAASILSYLPLNRNFNTEYVVLFTEDVDDSIFENRNEDFHKQKNANNDKKYLHAWKNGKVLLITKKPNNALVKPFCDGVIPITKYHYDGSTPINFS